MPTPEAVFRVRGISAKGKTLPPEKIKLFSFESRDMRINERRMKIIISEAEKYLDYEFPIIPLSSYRRYMIDGRTELSTYGEEAEEYEDEETELTPPPQEAD